jgi:hypothetical protein
MISDYNDYWLREQGYQLCNDGVFRYTFWYNLTENIPEQYYIMEVIK